MAKALVKLESLESLRGIAALMILVFHLAEMVKIPLPESLSFVRTHFGLGVPLFYTLSGFVLMYGYSHSLNSYRRTCRFYVRRFFRIAPLFYSMLLVWVAVFWVVWDQTFSLPTLFLNISFIFGLVPGYHESIVFAGWSIGIEMLFYAIFPALVFAIRSLTTAFFGFALACWLSTIVYDTLSAANFGSYAYMNLGTHLPFFMAGISAFKLWETVKFRTAPLIGWVMFGSFIIFSVTIVTLDQVQTMLTASGFTRSIWAVLFAVLILSACFSYNPVLESRPIQHLGKLSYSLYLLHPLIMLGLIEAGFPARIASLTTSNFFGFLIAASVSIFLVWFFSLLSYRLVEKPGIDFGKWLIGRYGNIERTHKDVKAT